MRLILPILFAISAISFYGQAPTELHGAALAEQNRRTTAVVAELFEMIRQDEKDPEVISSVGRRFLDELDRSIKVIDSYRNAKNRFGFQSEIDDYVQLSVALRDGRNALRTLTDKEPRHFLDERSIEYARSAIDGEIIPMIKEFADNKLRAEGAADFLTKPGFDTALNVVTIRIENDVRTLVEREIQSILKFRLHLGVSLRQHILMSAERFVMQNVGNIVLRMAANHFVVSLLATKLIDWIGPKLREFLRPKGNLEARVETASAGMKRRQLVLDSLTERSEMTYVRYLVEQARNHFKANNYLRQDIRNAGREDLASKLIDEEKRLAAAVERTEKRFMMNSPLAQESFSEAIETLQRTKRELSDVLAAIFPKAPLTASNIGGLVGRARTSFGYRFTSKDFPGDFSIQTSTTPNGLRVVVKDDSGRTFLDHELRTYSRPRTGFPGELRADNVKWFDGSIIRRVEMSTQLEAPDGTPRKGSIRWKFVGTTEPHYLWVEFVEQRTESGNATFVGTVSPSRVPKEVAANFTGNHRVELTGKTGGFQVRVVSPKGQVMLNGFLRYYEHGSSFGEPEGYRLYGMENGVWIDGSPAPRIQMTLSGYQASGPTKGHIRWYKGFIPNIDSHLIMDLSRSR
jgi:hypothetical protein